MTSLIVNVHLFNISGNAKVSDNNHIPPDRLGKSGICSSNVELLGMTVILNKNALTHCNNVSCKLIFF